MDAIKPDHYKSEKIDVIDICYLFDLNFSRGNALKYIIRAGKKDKAKEIEDLNKAIEYINREIEHLKTIS